MKRRVLVLAAIVAVLCVPSPAAGAPPGGSLHLTAVDLRFEATGRRTFRIAGEVQQGGQLVGTLRFGCSFRGRFEDPHCRGTISLPNGKLFLFLRVLPGDRGQFKVTGGTGTYQGKTGVVIYRDVSETVTRLTFWLTGASG